VLLSGSKAIGLMAAAFCTVTSLTAAELCVKVTDYGDLPLPQAVVSVINLAKANEYRARTDSKGSACIVGVEEGLYSVEAGLEGFLNVRYHPVRITYPAKTQLTFRLPFSEITEGGLAQDVMLSGTLQHEGKPFSIARVCVVSGKANDRRCVTATELGEYALSVPPGVYTVDVRTAQGAEYRTKVDVSVAGIYRNRITITEEMRITH
jgi:hypothetical protein